MSGELVLPRDVQACDVVRVNDDITIRVLSTERDALRRKWRISGVTPLWTEIDIVATDDDAHEERPRIVLVERPC